MVLPSVFEIVVRYEHQFVVADLLDRVAHDALGSRGILDIVDLELFVGVYRVVEFGFFTLDHIDAVTFRQGRDLVQYGAFVAGCHGT